MCNILLCADHTQIPVICKVFYFFMKVFNNYLIKAS